MSQSTSAQAEELVRTDPQCWTSIAALNAVVHSDASTIDTQLSVIKDI